MRSWVVRRRRACVRARARARWRRMVGVRAASHANPAVQPRLGGPHIA